MRVPRRVRTALVSREDSPSLTQRRINRLLCGNQRYGMQMPSWMLVNTRRQLAEFKVTNDVHLERLIQELKEFRVEFLVLDVFRSLHDSEENDNSEMQQVLQRINRIQNECECAVALVHHIMNADCTGTATITIPSSGTPPLVVYFVVNKHGRAVREVSNGNAIIATGEKVE